jgi:hypothetical protein
MVAIADEIQVAKRTPSNGTPAFCNIVGLTNMIYAIDINVVNPAVISIFLFVFNSLSLKYLSSIFTPFAYFIKIFLIFMK